MSSGDVTADRFSADDYVFARCSACMVYTAFDIKPATCLDRKSFFHIASDSDIAFEAHVASRYIHR